MAKNIKKAASTTDSNNDATISKARRVKLYLQENPRARNKDIVEALQQFGVKVSDVSNAKSYLKKKKRKKTVPSSASIDSNGRMKRGPKAKAASSKEANVSLSEFQSAITFVQSVGGLSRGRQLLEIVDQIKQL